MDVSWIWAAIAAIAAVLSSVWSLAQTTRMRSPYGRYGQWVRIRNDHPAGSSIRAYAEARVTDALVDLAGRGRVSKIRRNQWIAIILIFLLVSPIFLFSTAWRESSGWLGTAIGAPIAMVMIVADWRAGRARVHARSEIFAADAMRDPPRETSETTTHASKAEPTVDTARPRAIDKNRPNSP